MNKFEQVSDLGHQKPLVGWGDPQMNKFEQVSSFGQQMSLVGDWGERGPFMEGARGFLSKCCF